MRTDAAAGAFGAPGIDLRRPPRIAIRQPAAAARPEEPRTPGAAEGEWTESIRIHGCGGCLASLLFTAAVFLFGLWIGYLLGR